MPITTPLPLEAPAKPELEAIKRLTKDLAKAAITLSDAEARFLVDAYYMSQENRISAANQIRSLDALTEDKPPEPHQVIDWLFCQNECIENQIKRALDNWSEGKPLGRWAKAVVGIGPVIASGLLSHIDIAKAPTVGHIWAFAGLDPTKTWAKGQKRPWNANLKTLCVHPHCTVTTLRGHIPIAEVEAGDIVLTHLGRWRRVLQTMQNEYQGKLNGLRAANSGNQVAWLTDGHPVYAASVETWTSGRTVKVNPNTQSGFDWHAVEAVQPRWKLLRPRAMMDLQMPLPVFNPVGVECGDGLVAAQGRWENVPAPRAVLAPKAIAVDEDMMRFVGLFLAEGHISRTCLFWSFHRQEAELISFVSGMIQSLTGESPVISVNVENNSTQVSIGCKPLMDVFSVLFGTNGQTTRFPMEWLGLPDNLLKSLWRGIMEGDGDHCGDWSGRRISTGNEAFAKQCVDLGRRIGLSVSLHSEHGGKAFRVLVNSRPDVEVRARSTEQLVYDGPVYNLEVEEDHSYVVEGFAVHNCWKLGESFVKVSGNPKAYYGQVYKERKEYEIARNERGDCAEQAAAALVAKKYSKSTEAYKHLSAGHLPPAQIHARARRYAVKLFLAHYHGEGYRLLYSKEPPLPYAIGILGHAHERRAG